MSKKLFSALALVVFVLSLTVSASAQVGNGNVYDRGADGSGTRNWEVAAGITVVFESPVAAYVGDDVYVEVTVTNNTGRALPDITGWMGHVEFDAKDKMITGNAPIIFGYDSKGKPYYSNTLPDGASFTFSIKVDTSTAGEKVIEFDVWSRVDNKNWRELLLCACGDDAIVVNVIEKTGDFDADVDPDGNLIIPSALLGMVLPQTNGQDWLIIWLDGQEIFGNGNVPNGTPNWAKSGYNTNSKNIIVKNGALAGA
ncbi:MAG: hypothetical protein FWE67_13525, partial [Planctomycetaceae bacterium]|nr:hypothetical protein [Planctomycetaceae bacterium]